MSHSFYSQIRGGLEPPFGETETPARSKRAPRLQSVSTRPLSLPAACVRKLKGLSVAVVGGGFAGLLAARTLCRQGVLVTVFEARAQVGGRVLSDATFSRGRITEAGAELVGSIHTRWRELAIEYGLALISRMNEDLYRGQSLNMKLTLDKPLSMDEIRALGKEMKARVLLPIARLASTIDDASQPWLQPTTARKTTLKDLHDFDAMSVADALIKRYAVVRGSRLWMAMEMLLVNNNVKPLDSLNFLGLLCLVKGGQSGTIDTEPEGKLMGYWDELEIYRCADGCQKLAIEIAKDIQINHRCRVLLRHAVTQISLEMGAAKKPVSVGTKAVVHGKPTIRLPDEGFDYVILTIPPSVWDGVNIQPVHPKDAGQVGRMGMGNAVKFFSDVKERFWIKDGDAPYGGSLTLGQVWEGTDNQTRTGTQGIVLSVFAGGRSPNLRADDLQRELTNLYPNCPDYLTKKPLFANWPKQPFIETGYVSPGLKQILTVGKRLNEPFRGRLFFAGEHTQMDHFGYMEGALRSGERAANQLMQLACGLLPRAPDGPPVLVASSGRPREAESPPHEAENAASEPTHGELIEEEVLGSDDRMLVTDTLRMPNRWLCAIDVLIDNPNWGKGGPRYISKSRATGVLIGPRHVLTARHVMDKQTSQIDGKQQAVEVKRLAVSPARNGNNTKHPLGQAMSKSIHQATPYRVNRRRLVGGKMIDIPIQQRDDYALVIVDKDLASATHPRLQRRLGFWGETPTTGQLRRLAPDAIDGREVLVTGYPGDRCGADRIGGSPADKSQKVAQCARRRPEEWASTQWQAAGMASADAATTDLFHTADTYRGQSGGPICLGAGGRIDLIGIHTSEQSAQRNQGVRVTRRMLREICEWMNADAGHAMASSVDDGLVVQAPPKAQREDRDIDLSELSND